jgi:hypothetical protein
MAPGPAPGVVEESLNGLLDGVEELLPEVLLCGQGQLFAVEEERRRACHAQGCAVGDVRPDAFLRFLVGNCCIERSQVKAKFFGEGPEQRSLGFSLPMPLLLGLKHPGGHGFELALLGGGFNGERRRAGVRVGGQREVAADGQQDPDDKAHALGCAL